MSSATTDRAAAPDTERRSVHIATLGCTRNEVDSEELAGRLAAAGWELVDEAGGADVTVVNTCGFIDAAKEESIDAILEMSGVKGGRADRKLVVAGCLSQRYPDELANELPEVDHFLGSADMLGLRKIMRGDAGRMGVSPLSRRVTCPRMSNTSPRPYAVSPARNSSSTDR